MRRYEEQKRKTVIVQMPPLLQPIETLLQSQGIMQPQARTLALSILNYERNLQYQRQRYLASQQHPQPKPLPHIGARHAVPLLTP